MGELQTAGLSLEGQGMDRHPVYLALNHRMYVPFESVMVDLYHRFAAQPRVPDLTLYVHSRYNLSGVRYTPSDPPVS